ncbi:Hypothetical_protein [Hexamita inflata]|uniref:Hypothetical_protein n=1 Tax=Hexamita inflata TaxID=28002 RepID=A0AA86QLV2_9EUKA|nr:Hypothetical protein HINF_LOCUS49581 [Hexamita inflata]
MIKIIYHELLIDSQMISYKPCAENRTTSSPYPKTVLYLVHKLNNQQKLLRCNRNITLKYQQYFNLSQNDTKEAESNKIEILNSQTIQLGLIVKNLQNELKERKCGEENEQMMGQVIIEQDIVIKEMMAENQQLKFKLGQKDLQDVVK